MQNKSTYSLLIAACIFAVFALTPSCSSELATPVSIENEQIKTRTDFSGLEGQVKLKIAERDHISVGAITSCYYDGTTTEGYGRYPFTTSIPTSGIYVVTGIIGDDIEGW